MASCSTCSKLILFGGHKSDGRRYCSDDCLEQGYFLAQADEIPEAVVFEAAGEMHRGLCPVCGGSGPVDVHTSHEVWSLLLMTQWKSIPRISCRSCGVKRQLGGLFFSLVCGWWGFPWGLVMTPVQLGRNLVGLASPPDELHPSDALQSQLRLLLAEQMILDEQEKTGA